MNIELRRLSPDDGRDIYGMLLEIPGDENGFINGCSGRSYEEYKSWLIKSDRVSQGIGLEDWMVPQTIYWLYADGQPVGFGKLRHRLTDKLRLEGGHAGYSIRPSHRGKGYGKALLGYLIKEAKALGIDRLLLTIHNDNEASRKTAIACGGVEEDRNEERCYIWVDCSSFL